MKLQIDKSRLDDFIAGIKSELKMSVLFGKSLKRPSDIVGRLGLSNTTQCSVFSLIAAMAPAEDSGFWSDLDDYIIKNHIAINAANYREVFAGFISEYPEHADRAESIVSTLLKKAKEMIG